MPLQAGLEGRTTLTVTEADTALALGSGDVPVLGTPRVLALAEEAAVAALAGHVPATSTTVGAWVELHHLAPTRVGATVEALAGLVEVDDRRLEFRIDVHEGDQLVAHGRHRRVLVARARFT